MRAAGIRTPEGTDEAHVATWVAEWDRHGLDRAVSFASLPEEAESLKRAADVAKDRLIPFALVDPSQPDAADRVAQLTGDLGMRGLLVFPAMHRFDLSDPDLDPFYRVVDSAGVPLLVHLGVLRVRVRDILGLPADFDITFATPARLAGAAERYPGIQFVVPHFGGGYFQETLELGRRFPNLAVDTSSSNSWIRLQPGRVTLAAVFERTLEVFGAERVYFGTDSSVFPRGWRGDVHEEQRAALEAIGAPESDQSLIFGGNAARRLGLDADPGSA